MAQGNIEIKFTAVGNKKLEKAILDLDKSTKKLTKTSKTYEKNVKSVAVAQKKANRTVQRVTDSNKKANKSFLGLGGTLSVVRSRLLLYSFAVASVTAIMRTFLNTVSATREFEVLKTRLKSITGSAIQAEIAFQKFNDVAAKTPFTLRDITNAGVALKAFGADAEETIVPVADLAAFMGVNATEAAQAFGRAFAGGAGAADVLRERGVLALVKSFNGIRDLSKVTLPEFRKMLIETMKNPTAGIAGATEELSKTFEGSYSNMMDSLTRLADAFGQKLAPRLTVAMNGINKISTALTEFLSIPDEEQDVLTDFQKQVNALAGKDIKELEKMLEDAKTEQLNFTESTLLSNSANEKNIKISENLISTQSASSDATSTQIDMLDKLKPRQVQYSKLVFTNSDLLDVSNKVSEKFNKTKEEESKVTDKTSKTMADFALNVDVLTAALEAAEEKHKNRPHFFKREIEFMQKLSEKSRMYTNSVNGVANAYISMRQAVIDSEKQAELSATNGIRSERLRQREIEKINKKYEEKQKEANREAQSIKRNQTRVNTAVAVMEALSAEKPGFPGNFLIASLVAAQGRLQIKAIDAAKYEQGGLVGGRRHSQGGTMIEAERGEYVVSRRGVDAVGIEALNRINAGGTGGVNVSINNPILSKDVVEDDLIPQIKEAIRRGADIGVG